ncbi:hypothetical protein GE21DRAFT_1279300 [Neurospora crassa]|nr:hypothetical protein GE21DRAFT_1279300 [Neurospora crassa]
MLDVSRPCSHLVTLGVLLSSISQKRRLFRPRDGLRDGFKSSATKPHWCFILSPLDRYIAMVEVTVRSLRACTRRRIKPLSCKQLEVLSQT